MKSAVKHPFFWLLALLALFMLLLPHVLRWKYTGGNLIGVSSFYFLYLAQEIASSGTVPLFAPLLAGGVPLSIPLGWPVLLSLAPDLFARLLPLLFGLGTVFLFWLLCSRLDLFSRTLATFLLIISPPFLYLFSVADALGAAVFLSLLAVYLYFSAYRILSFLLASAVLLFSFPAGLLLFVAFLFFTEQTIPRWSSNVFWYSLFFIFFCALTWGRLFFVYGLPVSFSLPAVSFLDLFNSSFVEFGSPFGLSLFFVLIALYGLGIFFSSGSRFFAALLVLFLGIILSLPFTILVAFLNFGVVFFATVGCKHFFDRHWSDTTLRQLTVLIVGCALLFSSVAYLNELTSLAPTYADSKALSFLEEQTDQGVVVILPAYAPWILSTNHAAILSEQTLYLADTAVRAQAIDAIYSRVTFREVTDLLDTYEVRYIWVDGRVRDQYWQGRSDRGFLFLATHSSGHFSLAFEKQDVQIWEYHGA